MSSLYAAYVKERENKDIIESDKGFATYIFMEDGVYIEDIYVHPEYRKTDIASAMADEIAHIARGKGLKKLYGSVVPTARNSTASLKVLLAYGFTLQNSSNNFIWFSKDIGV